jgi:YidC/Oxa1 family membrane protein insertase
MLNFLYTIIIYPLVGITEFVFQVGFRVFEKNGPSIIGVSLAVTFLCLPLYLVAEKWQLVELQTINRLKPKINKIKAVFKDDEQYMILSVFYRQNHYHPLYGLRSSLGLLIQIPFFIAAYTYLSNLDSLKGSSFYFIRDLGMPDGLITINGLSINILPIMMTLINCIAGAIYTRNLHTKDRVQIYLTAVVFLILLYKSPSGLVLYWTMNNIFSLIKNIFTLFKKPIRALYITMCAFVLFLDIFLIFFHHGDLYKRFFMILMTLFIPLLPLIIKFYKKLLDTSLKPLDTDQHGKTVLFVLSLCVLCLLLGFVTPSYVINSSPQEFSYIESVNSPFYFLYQSFLQSLGLVIFWPLCIYPLFGKKVKTTFALAAVFLCSAALINTFVFSGKYGEFTGLLNFVDASTIKPSNKYILLNLLVTLGIYAFIIFLVSIQKTKILISFSIIILCSLFGISFAHSVNIKKEFDKYTAIRNTSGGAEAKSIAPIYHLSKDGKNVIVIMLDRAVNGFVPEIFSESPELYEQFSGFTWYPNTLSFNTHTLMGAPPLFGGYEYTPDEINSRSGEPLVKKNNEALLLMPVIFSRNNFTVTVSDPPWANYSWIPDIRIYADYPGIKIQNTIQNYSSLWLSGNNFLEDLQLKSLLLKRNFLWFSLFKSSPVALRYIVYNNGYYWNTDSATFDFNLIIGSYAVLDFLPLLTDTASSDSNAFLLIVNNLTHEPSFLQAPGYVPRMNVTNRGNSKYADVINYPVNAAALKMLGKWLNFLKEKGIYNNTRIIISSDHGANIDTGLFTDTDFPFRREELNPLLLIKDFDDNFPLKTDNSFMTNADVPSFAFKGIIEDPVNPFTGNLVNSNAKQGILKITTSSKWMPNIHNANTFKIEPDEWYTVHTNIFDAGNWKKLDK